MSTEGRESNQSESDQGSGSPQRISSVLSESKLTNLMREPTHEESQAERAWSARYESARRRSSREELLREFFDGESERYGHCTLENFSVVDQKQQAALDALREYSDGMSSDRPLPPGLLFYGPCGTGKDHLAIAVCRLAIERHGISASRINGQDWYGDLRDRIGADNAPSERSTIDRLVRPGLLLVSDPLPPFGKLTEGQATMLYRLVERRYFLGKPTIVTVNVKDGKEADDRMGAATWDRLKDGVWVIVCNWPSHRRPARIVNGVKP